MKILLSEIVSSIVRFLLVAYGGWLAANGFSDLGSDPASVSVIEIVMGTVSAGLAYALKFVDGLGPKAKIATALVGPRVQNIGWSISRWVVGLLAGFSAALVDPATGKPLVSDLGDSSVVTVVSLLVAFLYDRGTKFVKP